MTHLEQKEEKTEKSFQPKIKISNTRHLAMVTMGKYETSATIRSSEQKARWKEDKIETHVILYVFGLFIKHKVIKTHQRHDVLLC